VADQQPEGATFLVPVRLEACPIPQRLARWHWIDLFTSAGYEHLLGTLRASPGTDPDRSRRGGDTGSIVPL
jgi:hypothetical protein